MSFLRRLLGILVMIAGILGLVISLAGLIGIWSVRPAIANAVNSTVLALNDSIDTSQKAMQVTGEALGATVDSVDALSEMLGTTALSMEETKPVLGQITTVMSVTLPTTLESATDSLKTAQQAAVVLDSTIKSLDNFRAVMSAMPLFGALVDQPAQPYDPEVPLADSLGNIATSLEDMPTTFIEMSANLNKTDDNLETIKASLTTMSTSVALISKSLGEYQSMIGQSQSSMENLRSLLTNVQTNLPNILNGVATGFTAFFIWLLAAQIVILTQGWELYQGTAGRMEGGEEAPSTAQAS